MKKWLIRTAAAFLAAAVFSFCSAAVPAVSAESYILMDGDTGAVLAEHDADRKALVASTTKIMTAIVILEHMSPEEIVKIPQEATEMEGSSIYLKAGERLSVEELLYGMMLQSGNDAAEALALVCAGSVEEFAVLMNIRAQKLGLQNTHFENPSGLDGREQYSSARDLGILTMYALENPEFRKIVSTRNIQFGDRTFRNHNRLLWSLEGCIGVKTGYTKAAGRILVSAAERKGRRLIAVTICDGNDWLDHQQLYEYGFSLYSKQTVTEKNSPVGEITDLSGKRIPLLAGQNMEYYLSPEDRIEIKINEPRMAFSAGEPGTEAGYATVYVGRREIGRIHLIWGGETQNAGANTENHIRTRSGFPPDG